MKTGSARSLACAAIAAFGMIHGTSSASGVCGVFEIIWSTTDDGGGIVTGGAFTLESSTIGQPDPGLMLGSNLEFDGGFWPGMKPCPLVLQGDVNCDDYIDGYDLSIILGNWLTCGPGDLNLDGVVDGKDLAIVLGNWTGGPF